MPPVLASLGNTRRGTAAGPSGITNEHLHMTCCSSLPSELVLRKPAWSEITGVRVLAPSRLHAFSVCPPRPDRHQTVTCAVPVHLQATSRVSVAGRRLGARRDLMHSHLADSKGDGVETKATVSRGSSSSDLARALFPAKAMMPLQRETQAPRKAGRTAGPQRPNHKVPARRSRQHGVGVATG